MKFEGAPFNSKEQPSLVQRHIDNVHVGDLVSDNGELKPILEKVEEPDGGIRFVIQNGNPRYVSQNDEEKFIEVAE